jgi:hypothetical protein
MPMNAERFGHMGILVADKLCGVREVRVFAILPFTDVN